MVLRRMNGVMFDPLPRDALKRLGEFRRGIEDRTPATLAVLAASPLDFPAKQPRNRRPQRSGA